MIDSRAHRIKVLLVHSDQAQRRVLVKKLGNSFDVFGVSTVEEAIAQASQSKPAAIVVKLRWDDPGDLLLMEQLTMSRIERTRLEVFARVKARQIDKVKASELLGLSYRQVLRSYARYATSGAAGLTHASRGKPSNRGHDAAHRVAVLADLLQFVPPLPDHEAQRLLRGDGS